VTKGFFSPEERFGPVEEAAVPYRPGPGPESSGVDRARERNEPRLLSIAGVKGIGIGRNGIGDDAIVVFIVDSSVRARCLRRWMATRSRRW
jgi:hypothetical protein